MRTQNKDLMEVLLRIEAKLGGKPSTYVTKTNGKRDNSVREMVDKLMDDGKARTIGQVTNLLIKSGCKAKHHSVNAELSDRFRKGEFLRLGTGIYQKKGQ